MNRFDSGLIDEMPLQEHSKKPKSEAESRVLSLKHLQF
jgi:hypothetical protein